MSELQIKTKNKREQKKSCRTLWLLAPLALALALTACEKKPEGPQTPPPPQVGYITVSSENVGIIEEHPGRLEASRVADVRARVAGVLMSREFKEGSDVKAGELLFKIDDAPYRAQLRSAQAQLAQAQASLMQTKAQAERYKPLVAANAISKQDFDNALAAQLASEANIAAANAAITTARINLDYAAVTSPISGRIGRALVTEGALVGQGVATELAVVQQIDPMYVNFTQAATDVIKLQQAVNSGVYSSAGKDGSIPITVMLNDGTEYEHKGKLLFTDLTVDQTTGQVSLRATLPNPDGLLLPGLYVRVKLEQMQANDSYIVPQSAVTRSAEGASVYVINDANLVIPKPVVIGGRSGADWVVTHGLATGDRVMVDGVQKWQMAIYGAMQAMAAKDIELQGMPEVVVEPISRDKPAEGALEVPTPVGSDNNNQTTEEPKVAPTAE